MDPSEQETDLNQEPQPEITSPGQFLKGLKHQMMSNCIFDDQFEKTFE